MDYEDTFGALGVSDPVCAMPDATFGREIDFAKVNADQGKNYPIMPIPAGFVVTDVIVQQTVATDKAGAFALKLASDGTSVVADVSLVSGESDTPLLRKAVALGDGAVFAESDADMLCLCAPAEIAGGKITEGKVAIYVRGFSAFSEGLVSAPAGTVAWRKPLQTDDNVSGGQM